MLREIAANGRDVANLRRTDFRRRLLQAGEHALQFRMLLDFGNGDVRADRPVPCPGVISRVAGKSFTFTSNRGLAMYSFISPSMSIPPAKKRPRSAASETALSTVRGLTY